MASTFGVVLDANVLIPMALCDTLMYAAVERLYRPHWTAQILDEVERNLVLKGFATEESAQRRILKMTEAQPYAMVIGYKSLVRSMTNDPKDRHVLAAAVRADAQVIATYNIKDFPAKALAKYDIEAQSPDAFLINLYDMKPNIMEKIIRKQASCLKRLPNPATSPVENVLASLFKVAPSFAIVMKKQMLNAPTHVDMKSNLD